MALSIALPLSGLEPDQFYVYGARLLYEQGLRTLNSIRPTSPSAASESSGISSLAPSCEFATTETTPMSSRPSTPSEEVCKQSEKEDAPLRVLYTNRDILNLGANIREPFWQMRNTAAHKDDNTIAHLRNRHEINLSIKCITIDCTDCGFGEPSPYLF